MIKKLVIISSVGVILHTVPSQAITKSGCKSDLDDAINACQSSMGIGGSNTTGDILEFSNCVISSFDDKVD